MNVFTRYFLSQEHCLRLYDIDHSKAQSLAEKYVCLSFDSVLNAISDVDMVFLCTPIKETPNIIRDITPYLKKGTILCEIASLKMRTIVMLNRSKEHDLLPLSVHPMFGPDIKKIEGQTLVVIPVSDQDEETSLAKSLFPDTKIVVVDAETHDSCMASVLALPYFMNLAFARVLSPKKMALMRELAGTTFTVQLAVTQSIVGESPELIESLMNENMFSRKVVNQFIDECRYIRRLLKNNPREMGNFCESLKKLMMNDIEYINARRKRNEFFERLQN